MATERPGEESRETGWVLVDLDRDLIPLPTQIEPRAILEQQVLRVRRFRLSTGVGCIPEEEGERLESHLTLTLVGDPVSPSRVEVAVLDFLPDLDPLRAPTFDPGTARVRAELPLSRLPPIEALLRRNDEVYCRYQEHANGQVWVDLQAPLEEVGRG